MKMYEYIRRIELNEILKYCGSKSIWKGNQQEQELVVLIVPVNK